MSKKQILYVFPGQGCQYPGIGRDLYEKYGVVKTIYEQASDILGYDMARLSFHDPKQQINLTRYTQPVLLTHHYACLQAFRQTIGDTVIAGAAAGHSLGEYSALVAAGSLSFETALKLVTKRGQLMGEHGEGEMVALPMQRDVVQTLADKHYCAVAGCNLLDQTVVGGSAEDLDALTTELSEKFPRKRATRLKTEGAFHTYYMVTAARYFRAVLDEADLVAPTIKVLSNYSGGFHADDVASIKSKLFSQLFYPVLWFANMQTAFTAGYHRFIEFGGGIGSGETAAEKRPNLEGIIKKAFRHEAEKPDYLAVINANTLANSVQQLHEQ